MRYLRAVSMAFSMYSRLPMPWVRWSDDCRAWVLCAFPLVGAVLGLLLLAWSALADLLTLTPQLRAAGAVLLPLAYTGGIHMDGFCDTCDALASHQDRARKLEILRTSAWGPSRCWAVCPISSCNTPCGASRAGRRRICGYWLWSPCSPGPCRGTGR